MKPTNGQEELFALFDALLGGAIELSDHRRLEERLAGDAAARQLYFDYLDLHLHLRQWGRARKVESTEGAGFGGQGSVDPVHPSSFIPHPSSIPPIVIDPSPTLHSPLGSFLFSHLAAAVILGIGLLIGLAWRISLPSHESQEPGGTGYASAAVGRITALADCQWHKEGSGVGGRGPGIPKTQDQRPKTIYLGDRLAVASGLMEITYDTGAKVILEGPCTYEIDSDRGGYLAVGKLTARVDKKAEGGRRRADHYPLPTTHYPLFAVRTPTATVTDLGTEFGVEVEESGATRSHVFQGSVSIVPSPNGRGVGGEGGVVLSVGKSARVERGRNRDIIIRREPDQPGKYVRQIPSSFIPHPSSLGKSPSSLAPRPSPLYRLTDLGTLGGRTSRAFAINALGHVAGDAMDSRGHTRAFLFVNGKMNDLCPKDDRNYYANGMNASGHVVGYSGKLEDDCRAILFSNGTVTDIGTLGGHNARAFAINNTGAIVGHSQNANGVRHAFLYTIDRRMKDLGALGGARTTSSAIDINTNGQIVGTSITKDGQAHAFLYSNVHGMIDLGAVGGQPTVIARLNDAGQMVGMFSGGDGVAHAFRYSRKNGIQSIASPGVSKTVASGINNLGQVVGSSECAGRGGAAHAFFYDGGKMFDLNLLVDPALGWTLCVGTAINDSGQIAGIGKTPDGKNHAFLLTPVNGSKNRD